jgi:hypothetical protein
MVPEQNLAVAVMLADEKNADFFARKLIEAAQPLLGR